MNEVLDFLIRAREKTYASGGGKVEPALDGSTQLEYKEGEYLYRDIYYTGEHTFLGIETIYHSGKPVWSMVYHGDWTTMTEEEIDNILRPALSENAKSTRLGDTVEWVRGDFTYLCAGQGDTLNFSGTETISKAGEQVYKLSYHSTQL